LNCPTVQEIQNQLLAQASASDPNPNDTNNPDDTKTSNDAKKLLTKELGHGKLPGHGKHGKSREITGNHGKLPGNLNWRNRHSRLCGQVDLPIAGLLKDLKQRGLLDETVVVWGTEFGRTPGAQGADGRDHHPYGFSVWLAGGGIAHGATDELGFHAVENRHYVTDLHATVLHQLGLDPERLIIPGRQRLEMEFGHAIREIIA
jgi:hypothetical protein